MAGDNWKSWAAFAFSAALVGTAYISVMRQYKKREANSSAHKTLQNAEATQETFDSLIDTQLEQLFGDVADAFGQKMTLSKNSVSNQNALEMYGLFKQARQGDAPAQNPNGWSRRQEYLAWWAQRGKATKQAMQEYIELWTKIDGSFDLETAVLGASKSKNDVPRKKDLSSAMGQVCSKPKVDEKEKENYELSLDQKEKQIYQLYKQIADAKDEQGLINLIESGKIQATGSDKKGCTPLMHAINCNFSVDHVEKLIALGCDVNARDIDGMTSIEQCIMLGDVNNFHYLLTEANADIDIEDNDGSSARKECEDIQGRFLEILEEYEANRG